MIIRTAGIEDIDQLEFLFEEYRSFYGKKPDRNEVRRFLTGRIENNDSEIYTCELKDKTLAGFVQLYPYYSSTNLKRLWMLNDLFVKPSHRGKGISVQLIERAQKLVKETNAHALMLETGNDSNIGNKLYPKTGFKLYGGVNFYEWLNPENSK